LIRNRLSEEHLVYEHHSTKLAGKLVDLQHSYLLQVIACIHIHLDHVDCLEVIILQGKVKGFEKLANSITCLKGVKLSRMNILTTEEQLA